MVVEPALVQPVRAKVYPLFTPLARTASTRLEVVEVAEAVPAGGPMLARVQVKPWSGYVEAYVTSAVFKVRIEPTAEASFAAIRERSRFGIAMAAMIRMIATTISNSINEKPFCLRICTFPLSKVLSSEFLDFVRVS